MNPYQASLHRPSSSWTSLSLTQTEGGPYLSLPLEGIWATERPCTNHILGKKPGWPIIKRKEKKQTPVMVANANHNGQEYLPIQPKGG
jgi:hypothetical protein